MVQLGDDILVIEPIGIGALVPLPVEREPLVRRVVGVEDRAGKEDDVRPTCPARVKSPPVGRASLEIGADHDCLAINFFADGVIMKHGSLLRQEITHVAAQPRDGDRTGNLRQARAIRDGKRKLARDRVRPVVE